MTAYHYLERNRRTHLKCQRANGSGWTILGRTLAAALVALLTASTALGDEYGPPWARVEGVVCRAHDGDTFRVCSDQYKIKIRTRGIAAPELRESGGAHGRTWMQALEGKAVVCDVLGMSYNRAVADCWIDGQALGQMAIDAGVARACPAYGGGYVDNDRSRLLPLPEYCVK